MLNLFLNNFIQVWYYSNKIITEFTTCIETIYGITFMVLAPENKLVDKLKDRIKNWDEVIKYREETASTISSHISNLEKQLDIVLFYRERDGLTLTRDGKELYDSIHEKIKDIEFAENALIQNHDISKAKITNGII